MSYLESISKIMEFVKNSLALYKEFHIHQECGVFMTKTVNTD